MKKIYILKYSSWSADNLKKKRSHSCLKNGLTPRCAFSYSLEGAVFRTGQ